MVDGINDLLYVSKRQRICWISFLSVCLVMRELCVWGIRSMRYWGAFLFTMSCNRVNLCMFRLVCRVAHPVSRYSNVCEVCLFAPVTICAARICRFSSCDFNCLVELSKTTSLYSNTGLINDMYIISSVYRGSLYFNESIIFIRLEAVAHICSTWTDHVNLLSSQRPRCLWHDTFCNTALSKSIGTAIVGLFLLDINMDTDFSMLTCTSHCLDHSWITKRSLLISFTAEIMLRFLTTRNKDVSSA